MKLAASAVALLAFLSALSGGLPAQACEKPSKNHDPGAKYHYPKTSVQRIDARELGLCMAEAARASATGYSFDRHAMRKKPLSGKRKIVWQFHVVYAPLTKDRELLFYLEANPDRSYDLVTGQEEELKRWVLRQPDASVDPLAIYEESLALNRGNTWNAVLTVHQLLRDNARWWDAPRYEYASSKEEQERFFDKLVDIRGDLQELGAGRVGDHAGSWYRMWGTMLFKMGNVGERYFERMDEAARSGRPRRMAANERLQAWMDDSKASAIYYAEENWMKRKFEKDRRKAEIDRAGHSAAAWMLKGLWDPRLARSAGLTLEGCRARSYLKENASRE